MKVDEWSSLTDAERYQAWKKWIIHEDDLSELLDKILQDFREAHAELDVIGWGNVHSEMQLIVREPKDLSTRVPWSFQGVPVRQRKW